MIVACLPLFSPYSHSLFIDGSYTKSTRVHTTHAQGDAATGEIADGSVTPSLFSPYSQKQRNKALTLAHAQTIHYTSN